MTRHCDDEPLSYQYGWFGFGTAASSDGKAKSCLDGASYSCRLHHGDLLTMIVNFQDEYVHRTDPRLEQKRVNLPFRWIKDQAVCCFMVGVLLTKVFAGFISFCMGVCGERSTLGLLGAPVGSVDVEGASTSGLHSCLQDLGYGGVPGGGLSESAQSSWLCTCMLVWVKGTSWRDCRPKRRKTLFSTLLIFSDSSVLSLPVSEHGTVVYEDWEGKASWSLACGVLLLRSWIIGGWLTGDCALDVNVDSLAVVDSCLGWL